MHRGAQIAVGRQFQQLADVHHEGVFTRLGVNPPPFAHLHLQPFLLVLQQEAEKPGVLVRADALCAGGSVPPG